LKDDSLNHQTRAWVVSLAKSDPLTVGSSDHFDSVDQKPLPLGAELQLALNLISAHTFGINLDIEDRKQAEFYLAKGQRLAHMGSWAFNAAGFD
jgi:hypothetical protein